MNHISEDTNRIKYHLRTINDYIRNDDVWLLEDDEADYYAERIVYVINKSDEEINRKLSDLEDRKKKTLIMSIQRVLHALDSELPYEEVWGKVFQEEKLWQQ